MAVVELCQAHGRAPSSGTCWEQACPEGLTGNCNCQRSGSENWEQGVSAHLNAGNRTLHHPILLPRKTGAGGKDAKDLGHALGGRSPSAAVPRRAFAFFSHERKEGRRQAKPDPGKPGTAFSYRFFWRIQKKWFLERTPSRTLSLNMKKGPVRLDRSFLLF